MSDFRPTYNEELFREWVDNAKTKIDIVEVIEDHLMLFQKRNRFIGFCPFHEGSEAPTLEVNQIKQEFKCTECEISGDIYDFILRFNQSLNPGFTPADCIKLIIKEYIGNNIAHLVKKDADRYKELEKMYEAHNLMARVYHHVLTETADGKDALQYLRNRGITRDTIDEFQIGFAPESFDYTTQVLTREGYDLKLMVECGLLIQNDSKKIYDRFRGRIMFPIHDITGGVIAFGGRSMSDQIQPKYLNSPETPIFYKGENVYNLHRAAAHREPKQPLVLFEGYMDVITAWQAGCKVGTATLGTAFTEKQMRLIRSITNQTILCYDGDEPGQQATEKAIQVNEQFKMHIKVAPLPPGVDPDEYVRMWGPEAFHKHILGKATPAIEFRLRRLKDKLNSADPLDYKKYLDSVVDTILRLPREQEKEEYVALFEDHFNIPRTLFNQLTPSSN